MKPRIEVGAGCVIRELTRKSALPEWAVGEDKIRYLWFLEGRWRWCPTKKMRAAGFRLVKFGRELNAADKAHAIQLNTEWDAVRRGYKGCSDNSAWPIGSVGDAYVRATKLREQQRTAKGVAWTIEQRSRDDWPRAWKHLGPALGDCDPKLVDPEFLLALRMRIETAVSEGEAFRVIKVWRALWKRMAAMSYCERDNDPSLAFANSAPAPRQIVWQHRDVLRMVQRAWRMRYYGLAAVIATAWDTMLSPVDVRTLTAGQGVRDIDGAAFFLDRAKTGRAAAGTLTPWSEAILNAYLLRLGIELTSNAPIFRNRSGSPYSKDTLGDDFRGVRTALYGEGDSRQLQDMRRSGAGEAIRGGSRAEQLSGKMANSLSASNRLFKTYVPVDIGSVREVDASRENARQRERKANKKSKGAGPKSLRPPQPKA